MQENESGLQSGGLGGGFRSGLSGGLGAGLLDGVVHGALELVKGALDLLGDAAEARPDHVHNFLGGGLGLVRGLLSLVGGFIGLAGAALAGALIAAFGLSGLAALHDLSRGKAWRTPTLFAIYLALVVMLITVFPFLALLGIADALIDLRRRKPPASPAA